MSDNKKTESQSIFSKIAEPISDVILNYEIKKAQALMNLEKAKNSDEDEDKFYFKSVTEDPSYQINSQGFKEKPNRIQNSHLKQMSLKDSVVAAVIQTRQNQVSNYSRLVKSEQEKGWIICLKDEEKYLSKIKEELLKEDQSKQEEMVASPISDEPQFEFGKSEIYSDQEKEYSGESPISDSQDGKDDDATESTNWELERRAREKLEEKIKNRRKKIEEFIQNCGSIEERPFETKKWNFDAALRALTRDTLTYDFISTELIRDKADRLHHFFPVDASTIRFASTALKRYKSFPGSTTNVDLLYPEKQLKALEESDALELDDALLENDEYKFVQVIRGQIERAYTEKEMRIGIRNVSTDIYNNGYGVSELELLVSLVSSHLNTEYYNKAYFTQGFSAKGILHLKAPIPRRKLESIRQQWHHMVKGNRNSFQTPIFAGMDEVNWIPLTQNHSDIEFQGWMNYLIKMICAIYQIDSKEIGLEFKAEGKSGGISGDDTKEKLDQSKDKGLRPLLMFLENYVNTNIISELDSDFQLKFTGLDSESSKFALERQEKEVKFKKTVNEIRAEDGLPPLPGMDDFLLDPTYMQWYTAFSEKGMQKQKQDQENQMKMGQNSQMPQEETPNTFQNGEEVPDDVNIDSLLAQDFNAKSIPQVEKSLKIEYYKLGK